MLGLTIQQYAAFLESIWATVILSFNGFVGGAVLGFPLALLLISQSTASRWACSIVVTIVQGIPLPIFMFGIYFGAGLAGFNPTTLSAASLAMAVYSAAFLAEIWKGSLRAVPTTQWEAAECLALTKADTLFRIIVPQAFRIATPPTVGFLVQVVKSTSYAVVLSYTEVTYTARVINNVSNQPFLIFTLAGLIYFSICFPLSVLSGRLENAAGNYRKA